MLMFIQAVQPYCLVFVTENSNFSIDEIVKDSSPTPDDKESYIRLIGR